MSFDHVAASDQVHGCLTYVGKSFTWVDGATTVTFSAVPEVGMVEDFTNVESYSELEGYVLTTSSVFFSGAYPKNGDKITDADGNRYMITQPVTKRHPVGVVRIHCIGIGPEE